MCQRAEAAGQSAKSQCVQSRTCSSFRDAPHRNPSNANASNGECEGRVKGPGPTKPHPTAYFLLRLLQSFLIPDAASPTVDASRVMMSSEEAKNTKGAVSLSRREVVALRTYVEAGWCEVEVGRRLSRVRGWRCKSGSGCQGYVGCRAAINCLDLERGGTL
jgi:hypothetical protein